MNVGDGRGPGLSMVGFDGLYVWQNLGQGHGANMSFY
jgi:hypothetical protein